MNAYADTIGEKALTFLWEQHKPDAGFSYTLNQLEASFSAQNNGDVISSEWSFGDGTTSTEINPTHTYAQPGNYTVTHKVTNSIASVNIETKEVGISTHLAVDKTTYASVQLYPNPAKDVFYIQTEQAVSNLLLVDLSGKVVLKNSALTDSEAISTHGLQKGIYLVQIQIGNQVTTKKLVVQ